LGWAKWNVESNPHVSALIEIRSAILDGDTTVDEEKLNVSSYDVIGPALPPPKQESVVEEPLDPDPLSKEVIIDSPDIGPQGPPKAEVDRSPAEEPSELTVPSSEPGNTPSDTDHRSSGVLVGVVGEEERFDFCMCNPPFFSSMEEAGLNPRTACGGTAAEMVCPGGEAAFVARIIEDSVQLKHVIQCVSCWLIGCRSWAYFSHLNSSCACNSRD
jgi:type IV secretory pathway VirB10-like protein